MQAAAEKPLLPNAGLAVEGRKELPDPIHAHSPDPVHLQAVAPRKPQHHSGRSPATAWSFVHDKATDRRLHDELAKVWQR
jgi:hypothetical protein